MYLARGVFGRGVSELTNRLPANDRLRFNTFARMELSAATALGTARLIKERLPTRIGSDGRVLPTGAAAPMSY